jgi:hypothetical protein
MATATAAADEAVADLVSTDWECGDVARLPARDVANIVEQAEAIGAAGPSGAKPFLMLDVPDIEGVMFGGTILAVKDQAGWETYAIESGGSIEGAKRTADGRHAMIFSMLSRGGPGGSYTVVSTDDGFASFHCGTLDFPAGLNQPTWRNEYLVLDDVNGEPGGRLVLTGSAEREIDGQARTEHYRYESTDGGRSWGPPALLQEPPGQLPGQFADIGNADLPALKRELAEALQ